MKVSSYYAGQEETHEMKIHLLSDLHQELAPEEPLKLPAVGADIIVLAGDIDNGVRGVQWAAAEASRLAKPVVYVPGNHEYYGHSYPGTLEAMRATAAGTGVHLLDCEMTVLHGTRFLGATLWTDFCLCGNERQGEAMAVAERRLNDHFQIRSSTGPGPLRAVDTLHAHRAARSWLEERLAEPFDGPTVVVTHSGPSARSAPPQYPRWPLGPAFLSDLEPLMGRDRARLWVHGHTHWCVDYEVAGTRVVSKQRGYPGAALVPGFDPGFAVEI